LLYKVEKKLVDKHDRNMIETWTDPLRTCKKHVTNLYGKCKNMTKIVRNIFFKITRISNL
jgi:hypothetical protein